MKKQNIKPLTKDLYVKDEVFYKYLINENIWSSFKSVSTEIANLRNFCLIQKQVDSATLKTPILPYTKPHFFINTASKKNLHLGVCYTRESAWYSKPLKTYVASAAAVKVPAEKNTYPGVQYLSGNVIVNSEDLAVTYDPNLNKSSTINFLEAHFKVYTQFLLDLFRVQYVGPAEFALAPEKNLVMLAGNSFTLDDKSTELAHLDFSPENLRLLALLKKQDVIYQKLIEGYGVEQLHADAVKYAYNILGDKVVVDQIFISADRASLSVNYYSVEDVAKYLTAKVVGSF